MMKILLAASHKRHQERYISSAERELRLHLSLAARISWEPTDHILERPLQSNCQEAEDPHDIQAMACSGSVTARGPRLVACGSHAKVVECSWDPEVA